MNLTEVFAGIYILISTMGLFGLASFTTEQRSKEIAVRKVLGASTMQVVAMLSKNLVILVVVASLPAVVVSYLTIDNWLERFAYRAESGLITLALPFVSAIIIVSFVALATVIAQSLKTARRDPVDALRYE
jgi:putative ABC transport system permease protein